MAFYRCGGPTRTLKPTDGFFLGEMTDNIRIEPVDSMEGRNMTAGDISNNVDLRYLVAYRGTLGGSIIVPYMLGQSNKYINAVRIDWNAANVRSILTGQWRNTIDIVMSCRRLEWLGGDPCPITTTPQRQVCTLSSMVNQGYVFFNMSSGNGYPAGMIINIEPEISANGDPLEYNNVYAFFDQIGEVLGLLKITFQTQNIS